MVRAAKGLGGSTHTIAMTTAAALLIAGAFALGRLLTASR